MSGARRDWQWAGAVAAVALLVRLLVYATGPIPDLSPDARNYDQMVRQLLERDVYGYMSTEPNAYVSPGYPLFMAALYAMFGWHDGSPYGGVRLVQVALGALTSGLLYLIGRQVHGSRAGWIAGLASAVYPPFVFMPLHLLTETLHTFLYVLYVWLQLAALQARTARAAAGAGALLGLAVLVRPAAAPLLLLPWALDWLERRDRETLRLAAAGLAGFVAVLLPWWVRNYLALGRVVLLATQAGNPLIAGAIPYAIPVNRPPGLSVDGQLRFALAHVAEGFRTQPFLYLHWFTVGKFLRIFAHPFWTPAAGEIAQVLHFLLAPPGWVGALLALRRPGPARHVAILAMGLAVLHLPFVPEPRYNYGIMPLLLVTGGALVAEAWGLAAAPASEKGVRRHEGAPADSGL